MRVGIGFADACTTLGCGEALWHALLEGQSGLVDAQEIFSSAAAPQGRVGCFAEIPQGASRVEWILLRMLENFLSKAPIEACDVILVGSNFGDLASDSSETLQDLLRRFFDCHFPNRKCREVTIVSSACSSGTDVVALGAQLIDGGGAQLVAALAVDCFDELKFLQHRALGTQSLNGARPFDLSRDGTSFGEGGGVLILGSSEGLQQAALPLLATIRGVGATCDGYDLTAPDPSGQYSAAAIRQALIMAPELESEIGFIKGHGSGTKLNDEAESRAIHGALGGRGGEIPVFSTKGAVGHLLGATGLVELVVAIRALIYEMVPGTVGMSSVDSALGLKVSPLPQEAHGSAALATTFGFGGINSAILLSAGTYA